MLANINHSLEGLSQSRSVLNVIERTVKCYQLFAEIIFFLDIPFERFRDLNINALLVVE